MNGAIRYHELKATINASTSASHGSDRVIEVAIETIPGSRQAEARSHVAKHGGISPKKVGELGGDPRAARAAKREYDKEVEASLERTRAEVTVKGA